MIIELNKAFSNICFSSKNHTYFTKDGEELISVTKLINRLKSPFNSKYWSTIKAYEHSGYETKQIWVKGGFDTNKFHANKEVVYLDSDHSHLKITPDDMLYQWSIDSLVGTTRGSYAHLLLENLENRILDKPEVIIPAGLDTFQTINYAKSINIVNKLCEQYLEEYNYLIPIAIEYKVGDVEMGIAGTLDRLYFNELTNAIEVWDFKTDKKISSSNKYQKIRLFDIDECELSKYAIQTSFYKRIIEKNTNLKLGQSNIIHLNIRNESLDRYVCDDFTETIANIDWRKI